MARPIVIAELDYGCWIDEPSWERCYDCLREHFCVGAIGFAQEQRAAGVMETLRRRLQISARVLRDGNWQVVPARELVPGDIIRVRPGDVVPADVKVLTGTLAVDQSTLTGESKDVDKSSGEVLSSGSIVRQGEGNGVVMLTGAKTYLGRTTELVQIARPKLHIEAVIAKVVRWLFVIVGTLLTVVTVLSLIRGAPLVEMVPLLLVLLMSAVPVALPVMFTVSMAIGSAELANRGVLVTRISASEDAATMNVLCVDKTGTITKNELQVTGVIPLQLLDFTLLCGFFGSVGARTTLVLGDDAQPEPHRGPVG